MIWQRKCHSMEARDKIILVLGGHASHPFVINFKILEFTSSNPQPSKGKFWRPWKISTLLLRAEHCPNHKNWLHGKCKFYPKLAFGAIFKNFLRNHEMYSSPCNRPLRPRGGVALQLYSFFNLGARWDGWSTPRPGRFTPGKDPVSIV